VPAQTVPETPTPPRGRGRPPGPEARVRRAVLGAALDELIEFGYGEFRIERVAERANVHKTTLYRQWGTRTALAKEAIADWQREQLEPIDTGSWESDVCALCQELAALESSPISQALLRTLVVANVVDPELTSTLHELWARDAYVLQDPIRRAQARGEVDPTLVPQHVIEMITGPLLQRVIVTAMPIDDDFVETIVSVVVAGTAPRKKKAASKPRRRSSR